MENTHPTFFEQYKYHLIGGGIVLATVIGIVIWQVRKRNKPKVWTSNVPPTVPPAPVRGAGVGGFCQSRDYPLRYGSCHPDVTVLQTALKALGVNLGTFGPNRDGIDGKFGRVTENAVLSRIGKKVVSEADMDRVKAGLRKWRG